RAARGLGALLLPIAPGHVVLDDGLEFLGDMIALECHGALAIHVHRRGRHFARARQADADVRMAALARPIDDAAHDGDVHVLNTRVTGLPDRHLGTQVGLDAGRQFLEHRAADTPAARTGHDQRGTGPQAHGLQHFLRDDDYAAAIAGGLAGERDADRVADAFL